MKQMKSFIAYRHEDPILIGALDGEQKPFYALETALETRTIVDPVGNQWRTIGFVANPEGRVFYRNDSAILAIVAIRERILPGAVLREEVAKMAANMAERQGFAVPKKQFAEIREDAEAKLLPKAFIRETLIPVIMRQKWMWICTSSQARADDAVGLLLGTLDIQSLRKLETVMSPETWMTQVARDGSDDDSELFAPGRSVALKGHEEAKGVITFRDEDVSSERVEGLITHDGYTAVKMAVDMDGGAVTFNLDTKLVFRSVKLEGITDAGRKEDPVTHFDSNLTLVALAYQDLMRKLVTSMGGIKPMSDDALKQAAADMDKARQAIRDAGGDLQPGVRAALDAAQATAAKLELPTSALTGDKGDDYTPRYWFDENGGTSFISTEPSEEPGEDDTHVIEITKEAYDMDDLDNRPTGHLGDLLPKSTTLNVFTQDHGPIDDEDDQPFTPATATPDYPEDDDEL